MLFLENIRLEIQLLTSCTINRNGRWRSTWVVNPESGKLKGTIKVNVHYYEDGNVQLDSNKDIEVETSTTAEVTN
jgi:hypothetical protein